MVNAALPTPTDGDGHFVELIAYDDTDLDGWSLRWFDALNPSEPKQYHVVGATSVLRDGKKARIYGSITSPNQINGIAVYGGGAVGPLPTTGVVFQLVDPNGKLVHELPILPEPAFTTTIDAAVLTKEDEARTLFVPNSGSIEPGHYRLAIQLNKDAGPGIPKLSVGGQSLPEQMVLAFTAF